MEILNSIVGAFNSSFFFISYHNKKNAGFFIRYILIIKRVKTIFCDQNQQSLHFHISQRFFVVFLHWVQYESLNEKIILSVRRSGQSFKKQTKKVCGWFALQQNFFLFLRVKLSQYLFFLETMSTPTLYLKGDAACQHNSVVLKFLILGSTDCL